MERNEITIVVSNKGTRRGIREKLVEIMLKEEPGTLSTTSGYRYFVETLQSGDRIYLDRPANKHYGFDFLICVEKANFATEGKKRNYPKHDDIKKALLQKKNENPIKYHDLYKMIESIYYTEEIDAKQVDELEHAFPLGELSVELIVKTLKWFFIEQDIRYWNYSGRIKTWGIIPEP